MGVKLHYFGKDESGANDLYVFHCPGCNYGHPFAVPKWSWNGSFDKPTFTPSLLCNKDFPDSRCHSHVTDGMVQFLDDCWHSLRGTTVEIPDWSTAQFSPSK